MADLSLPLIIVEHFQNAFRIRVLGVVVDEVKIDVSDIEGGQGRLQVPFEDLCVHGGEHIGEATFADHEIVSAFSMVSAVFAKNLLGFPIASRGIENVDPLFSAFIHEGGDVLPFMEGGDIAAQCDLA